MLKCPKCGIIDTIVVDSRDYGEYIRRRRKCRKCGHKQTTYERVKSKRGLLKENARRVTEYRKHYLKDKRPDEKILEALTKMDDVSYIKLIHGFVWLEGQLNG